MKKISLIAACMACFCPVFAQMPSFDDMPPRRICSCELAFQVRQQNNRQSFRPFIVMPCQHEPMAVAPVQNHPNPFDFFKRKRKNRAVKSQKSGSIIRLIVN